MRVILFQERRKHFCNGEVTIDQLQVRIDVDRMIPSSILHEVTTISCDHSRPQDLLEFMSLLAAQYRRMVVLRHENTNIAYTASKRTQPSPEQYDEWVEARRQIEVEQRIPICRAVLDRFEDECRSWERTSTGTHPARQSFFSLGVHRYRVADIVTFRSQLLRLMISHDEKKRRDRSPSVIVEIDDPEFV